MSRVIDGRSLAKQREELLKLQVENLVANGGQHPLLMAIELTRDQGSQLYLRLKRTAAARLGIEMKVVEFSKFPKLSEVDGLFVQHPRGIQREVWEKLTSQIPPEKDVDCLTRENQELLRQGRPRFLPATIKAIGYCIQEVARVTRVTQVTQAKEEMALTVLKYLKDRKVVILGRSPIVGQPLAWWFEGLGIKFDGLHSQTKIEEQESKIKNADVIISATGRPGIITGEMVKAGVAVIDVGSPLGDVDFASVSQKASAITPVPGGVGPLTVISLMENVVQAATNKVVL